MGVHALMSKTYEGKDKLQTEGSKAKAGLIINGEAVVYTSIPEFRSCTLS